jgi:hypothetical protein
MIKGIILFLMILLAFFVGVYSGYELGESIAKEHYLNIIEELNEEADDLTTSLINFTFGTK